MSIFWKYNRGFGLIEILIAAGVISVVLSALFGLFNDYLKASSHNKRNIEALGLAQEAMESVRSIRDESWSSVSVLVSGAVYHPVQEGEPLKWNLVPGAEEIRSIFLREIVFGDVNRNDQGDIVEVGGTLDLDTKKITVSVCWNFGDSCEESENKVNLTAYITNWR